MPATPSRPHACAPATSTSRCASTARPAPGGRPWCSCTASPTSRTSGTPWSRGCPLDRWHVVTYDVRGAGSSDAPDAPAGYRTERLVDDLVAVLDAVLPDGDGRAPGRPRLGLGAAVGRGRRGGDRPPAARPDRLVHLDQRHRPSTTPPGSSRRPRAAGVGAAPAGAALLVHRPVLPAGAAGPPLAARPPPRSAGPAERARGCPAATGAPGCGRNAVNGLGLYRANVFPRVRRPAPLHTDVPVLVVQPDRDPFVTDVFLQDLDALLQRPAGRAGRRRALGRSSRTPTTSPRWSCATSTPTDARHWTSARLPVPGAPAPGAVSPRAALLGRRRRARGRCVVARTTTGSGHAGRAGRAGPGAAGHRATAARRAPSTRCADALRATGRDVVVVPAARRRHRATSTRRPRALDDAADAAMRARPAPASVDVVGYSAGGVVARLVGPRPRRRRAGPPGAHARLAAARHRRSPSWRGGIAPARARSPAGSSSRTATCSAGSTPATRPRPARVFVSVWTDADEVVVPPDSARLDGALDFTVQSVLPGGPASPRRPARRPGGAAPCARRRAGRRRLPRHRPASAAEPAVLSSVMSLVAKFAQAAPRNTSDVDALQQRPRGRRRATGSGRGTGRRTTASSGSAGTAAARRPRRGSAAASRRPGTPARPARRRAASR